MAMGVERAVVESGLAGSIRHRRRALGMTMARLAEDVGVRPSDLGRWERGEEMPGPTRIRAIARVLGVDQRTMLTWIAAAGAAATADGDEVQVVIDLAPPDPFVLISSEGEAKPRRRPVATRPRPAATRPTLEPPRPVASVFPTPHTSLDADRHVYVATTGFPAEEHPRLHAWGRTGRTAIGIVTLGAALVWALRELGSGMTDLARLFGTPSG